MSPENKQVRRSATYVNVCFEQRFKGSFPHIPTYYAPVPLAELKSRAKSTDELQRVVRIVRDLKENGKVISCSMQVVDRLTEKTIFLCLGNRYYDETDQYDNELGLGDPDKGFKKPQSTIDAYDKVVPCDGVRKYPQPDQTAMRHGPQAEKGTSVHRFPIAPEVKWTSKRAEAGLRNTQVLSLDLSTATQPGEGCEPAGGLYMAKDMCPTSGGTTAVGAMYKNTETLELNVEAIVKVAFPEKYNDMKAICDADCTIHAVGDWKAVHMEAGDETTPGRIGTVFYIPQSSAEALAGKGPGWGLKTNFGRLPA
ncbi:hypothetical protein B0H14DRAFT_2567424 [Mycena olivaceomarginata]|nr:hypothetical protein B0H14DRAFT_2567424 [Mycena olivaceomarginata]